MVDLDAAFRAVNTSASGTISPAEVQAALALGGLSLSRPQAALLVKLYDANKNGGVDRAEFGALHGFLDGLVTAHADAAAASPATAGGVDVDAADAILRAHTSLVVDRPPLAAAFAAFDADGSGVLAKAEFVGLACFLASAAHVFAAFAEAQGGGDTITLTRDQWMFAAASCR